MLFYSFVFFIISLLKNIFFFLESFHPLLDNIISVLIYFFIYIFFLYILRKDKKLYKIFLIYFLSLNLVFYGLNHFVLVKDKINNEDQVSQISKFYNDLDFSKIDESKNKTNIFIVILEQDSTYL